MNSVKTGGSEVDSRVERYVAGRMSEAEELDFETAMLESRELAMQVQAERGMRNGLRRLDALGELDFLTARRRHSPSRVGYALAATVLFCVVGATILFMYQGHLRSTPAVLAGSLTELQIHQRTDRQPATFILAQTRSQTEPPTLPIPSNGAPVIVQIFPETPPRSETYSVRLDRVVDAGTYRVAGEAVVRAERDGSVRIYVNSSRLTPGDYQITLTQSDHVERFRLRAARERRPSG